jgi:hypothetical protein
MQIIQQPFSSEVIVEFINSEMYAQCGLFNYSKKCTGHSMCLIFTAFVFATFFIAII